MTIMTDAALWLDAARYSGSGNWLNAGSTGSALDATFPGGTANPTFLAAPTVGFARGYMYTPGAGNANGASTPDAAAVSIIGDITVDVYIAADDYTPSAAMTLAAKWGAAGQRSYRLVLLGAGTLRFDTTSDGTTSVTNTSSVATGITDLAGKWVRASLDVDDGAGNRVCKFYTADAGADGLASSWTQLGSTVTTAVTTSIFDSTANVTVGNDTSGQPYGGITYRVRLFSSNRGAATTGTPVLDIDFTDTTSQTTFTCSTGQTVTFNRATSGRKLVQVIRPCWLFGTDDYMTIADNANLDFGNPASFTVVACVRRWATTAISGIACKRSSSATTSTDPGWLMRGTTGAEFNAIADDGTNVVVATSTGITEGDIVTMAFTSVNGRRNTPYVNGVAGTPVTNSSLNGTLANALAFEIGRAGTDYAAMELFDVAVFRSEVSDADLVNIAATLNAGPLVVRQPYITAKPTGTGNSAGTAAGTGNTIAEPVGVGNTTVVA